ncbi:MAG: flippase-like domain-containing protein [Clostridia bacterium]|nr:flippase-like domain-containing protein [Clostridia bacterium]
MEENKEIVELNNEEVASKKKQSFFSRIIEKHKEKKAKKLEQINKEKLSEAEHKKVEEKLVEASKEVEQKSSKKKKIKNVLFFILNVVLVAGILMWNIFSSDDFTPLNLSEIKFQYVAVVLFFLVLIVVFDVMAVHRMIYRKTMRSRWALAYKSTSILRYYDAVTPMATGGQAFMVTYLTSRDVPGSTALSIPIAKLLFQNSAWLIITAVCLVVSFATGMSSLVSVASILGFILAFALLAIILLLSLSKKVGNKLVTWVLKLLVKMRILKNYDKHYAKVQHFVEDYQNIMKEYGKTKFDIVYQIVLHGFRNILLFSIPYFIYLAFPPSEGAAIGDFSTFFVYAAMIDLASSFIPLPGGTGMNEITFTALFSQYLKGHTFWALLLWRFCSYYFYLLQGLGVVSYDAVYGNRKYRWVKKKFNLQQESQEFKRLQIEVFRQERNKRRRKQKV